MDLVGGDHGAGIWSGNNILAKTAAIRPVKNQLKNEEGGQYPNKTKDTPLFTQISRLF